MEKSYNSKYDSIKDFLFILFSLDDVYKHKDKIMENAQILINEQKLRNEISSQWIYLLGNSENFDALVDEFIKNRYIEWSKKLETFQNIKTELEIKKFIKKNFPLSMLIRYETGSLSRNEVLRFLEFKEPKIKDFYHGRHGKYLNFLIYNGYLLHINLHLKLKEYRTGTYGLLILISFWNEKSEFFDTMDLNFINESYNSSILCYKNLNKLLSLGFKKFSLFEISEYLKDKHYPNIKNEWAKSLPHLFITVGIDIINENPVFLFEDLASKLNQIEMVINHHERSPILNPNDWYNSLSVEVQTFMEKGKELFLKIEEKYQEIEKGKIADDIRVKEPKENELTIEDVTLLFKDLLEKDKQNEKVDKGDKGFRTIHSFFKECKKNLKRKSLQTLYNYFKQWKDLDYYLESRLSKHQGGGEEHKYKEGLIPQKTLTGKYFIEAEEQKKESFQKEKIQIQQALNYYNNQNYEKAKTLLIKISKNPSKDIIKDEQLYYGMFYYIGRCYQQLKDYPNASNYFKKIYSENKDFINVNFHYIESSLELGTYTETFQIIEYTLSKLKGFLKIFDIPNYYMIYDDLEFTIRSITSRYDSHSDDLRPYIEYLESNDFRKYIIEINKVKPDLRILSKPFDEKDYTKIYHNFMLTEKFYKILMRIWFIKSECFRRYLYENIINKKTDILNEAFNDMIIFFKEIQQLNLRSRSHFLSILSFVHYYIGLTRLFDLTEIQNKLEENFPEGKNLHISPEFNFLKKLNKIISFLNTINQSFNNPKGVFRYKVRRLMSLDLNPRKKTPYPISLPSVLEAEFLFIKISLLEKYVLNDLINEEKSFLENIKNNDTDDIGEIFKDWDDFHFCFNPYRNLINYNVLLLKFEEICQNYNTEIYKNLIKDLKTLISNKLEQVKELRTEGRNYALNRIFKMLHSRYKFNLHEFEVPMEEKPENTSIEYFLYDSIQSEIKSIIQKKVGKIRTKLSIGNKRLVKILLSYLKERGFFIGSNLDFSLWLEPEYISEGDIEILEFYCKINLTYEKVRFEEHLDIIPLAIFQVINLNADELYIQISEKFFNDFKTYFQDHFLKEYKNNFFKFSVIEESDKHGFRIKIKNF